MDWMWVVGCMNMVMGVGLLLVVVVLPMPRTEVSSPFLSNPAPPLAL